MSAQIGSRLSAWMLVGVLGVGSAIAGCTPSPEEPAEIMLETEVVTLYVGPETAACVEVAPQGCLQVRYAPEEDYQLFYSAIEGFTHTPGYDYELLVQITPITNPPADGASLRWTLIDVVSQTPVVTEP
ncbi:MAG: DUF4377 domain-containing protein [Cyanobacteria bacterium J06607_6]